MVSSCPARTEMESFLLGTLAEPAAVTLTGHLEECRDCLAELQGLRPEDPLLRALRAEPLRPPEQTDESSLRRLKQLPFAQPGLPVAACSAPADTMPTTLGRYQLQKCLGAGGMGTVYQAFDPELKRTVAIKVPRFEWAEDRQRFVREARSAAAIRHPHVCPVYDVGEHLGKPYVVMAYIEGQSLADRLRRQGCFPDARQAVTLACQMARALEAVHAHGIIHRDLKPDNILLDQVGQAWLTDFGVAHVNREDAPLTADQVAVGTLPYMSPESLAGGGKVDARSDIYGLGVVLHQLLTGQLPAGTATNVARLDPGLQRILDRMLAKQPADRWGSAAELAEGLESWLASSPRQRRVRPGWLVASLAAAALIVAAIAFSGEEEEPPSDPMTSNPVAVSGPAAPATTVLTKPEAATSSFDTWMAALLLLPVEERIEPVSGKLRELNPGFDGTIKKTYDVGRLTDIHIYTDQVSNITPLRALQGILRLACVGSAAGKGALVDLSPLAGMRLDSLTLSNNPHLRDLKPLADLPLVGLTVVQTDVEDLTPLKDNPRLRMLSVSSSRVRSLEALRGMKLVRFYSENTQIKDLTPVAGSTLQDIRIRATLVTDLRPLLNSPLTDISLDPIDVEDAGILASIPTLKVINGRPAQEALARFSHKKE